jgi:hypothetical protein
LDHPPKSTRSAPKKGAFDRLVAAVFSIANQGGLIEARPEASIDATGLESHHVSRHFLARAGRMKQFRRYPKLTIVSHHATYLIAALAMRHGPCNDAPDFLPAVMQAVRYLPIHRLFGDGAYDAELHHRVCREELGIASTIIPINPRGSQAHRPLGPHRRRMFDRFPKRLYGRRWHAESTISQHKRRLGSALTARTPRTRASECMLRIVTHDLMILRRAS